MNRLVTDIINRWKSYRNRKLLQSPYSASYAFVGVGSHALQNLYPVLQYVGIKLKYICCKSTDKLQLIERRFGIKATTSLEDILNDDEVRGVFVCTSPDSHYSLCKRIIDAGKYVFVEKPPCRTADEFKQLVLADTKQLVMTGMQKRYSPYVRTLKAELLRNHPVSYTMVYHTGAYPEGNYFTDLFIHAVDLSIFLFGNAEIKDFQHSERNGTTTIQILLSHSNIIGFMELSTAFSWSNPEETLRINTTAGEYRLLQMEKLSYYHHPRRCFGVPLEKIGLFTVSERILAERNNFNPLAVNNQLYSQGFIPEIKAFAEVVEYSGKNYSALPSLVPTYKLLDKLQKKIKQ